MEEWRDTFDTRLEDLNRLHELGFIDWEERGTRVHEVLLQEISEELDRIVEMARQHPKDFPLDK